MSTARRVLSAIAALVAIPTIASAQLAGSTVGVEYRFPTQSSLYASAGTAVVGAGVEFPGVIGYFSVDVSNNNITADYGTSATWSNTAFNGFVLFDVGGTAPSFTSVTINPATNMVGLDPSRITFDADNIYVNWRGLSFNEHTIVSLDVSASTVPEPATVVLMGAGLLGTGLVARRRRSA